MSPWLPLVVLTAGLNLSIFVFVRGRWGRIVPLLALAALAGAAAGSAIAGRIGLELIRIGDFNFVAASVSAQLAMLAASLLAVLLSARRAD